MTERKKAVRLLELHHGSAPMVLINAWEAASACIVERAGFPAIATSSAAVANALGHADGQHTPWTEMVDAIRRIATAVSVPVTADIEAGFSATAQDLERNMEQIVEAGAVCIFVPGLTKPEHIRSVVEQLKAPVNVLGLAGMPSIPELGKLGVRRVSMGSGAMRVAMSALRRFADEARTAGTYSALATNNVTYAEMNGFFEKKS